MRSFLRFGTFGLGLGALLFVSACLAAPASPAAPTVGATPSRVARAAYASVILGDGAWTPDAAMIAELETRLPAYLAQRQTEFSALKAPIAERLAQYKFQYWGEMQNDKRVIVVNAFCADFEDWQTRRVFVLDGGDCFFQLKYDIASGTFFDLQVNGEA
ncbi:MAG: hypothetical protein HDKAJFGB_02674 [Anaerolineae bacterium]|nr:hypothetical protein [Anaerolineae bacterium]